MRPHEKMTCSRGRHVDQVVRAVPIGARLLLECAGAVVAAAPSKFKVSCLTSSALQNVLVLCDECHHKKACLPAVACRADVELSTGLAMCVACS